MTGIQKLAKHMATHGRKGDSILIHAQPRELAMLERLSGVKTTTNPTTGLPEAFSLWKFLAGLGGIIASPFTGGISAGPGAALLGAAFAPSDKKKVEDESAAGKYIKQRGIEDKAEWNIPILKYGAADPLPQGYVPGLDPERNRRRIPSILGSIDLNGKMKDPWNAAEGGSVPAPENAEEIFNAAVRVLMGQSQDPQAIERFVARFGEEKLQMLVAKIQEMQGGGGQAPAPQQAMGPTDADIDPSGMARGGLLKGPGGAMDDLLRARVAGGQRVALGGGEEIIPGDAVAHLGDGSTDEGHRRLRAMVARIRQQKTGSTQQPRKINPSQVMPA